MNIPALQLLSKFALPPNNLNYCGQFSAHQSFIDCITSGSCDQIPKETKHFIVLWPYLKTVGQALSKDPFSPEVIEAYWFGNDFLKQIKPSHYQLLIQNLKVQGIPDFLLDEIKPKQPDPFIPIHLFNILHVGVGKASGSVPFNLESINHCMIRWGVIKKITPQNKKNSPSSKRGLGGAITHQATLDLVSIANDKPPYQLTTSEITLPIDPRLTPNLQEKDIVAIHWQQIVHVLTPHQQTHLSYWTNALLQTF